MSYFYYSNRYICDVFEDIRKCDKTKNYGPLSSLLEEAQIMANRMEDALEMQKGYRKMRDELASLKREIRSLKKKKKKLGDEMED